MDETSLTDQLRLYSGGDRGVAESVLRQVLPRLHQIAARELHRERVIAPLSPTELINEVWISSLRRGGWTINNRDHFYAIAAIAMRRVLVDFARQRLAKRRASGTRVAWDEIGQIPQDSHGIDPQALVAIGVLMDRLEETDIASARIVDMHYFAGFTLQEIAEITGMSLRQVRHRWERGRNWLKDRLES